MKMNKKKQLAKNTIILLIGKISTKFISFLLIPLYTSKLHTGDYGFVDLIVTYVLLLSPIISLQLESACFRFITENRDNENKCIEIIDIVFSILVKLILLSTVLYFLVSEIVYIRYKMYIYFAIVSCILNDVLLQIIRGFGNNIKYSIACFINGITNVIFNIVFIVFLDFGAQSILISMILSNLITIIYMFFSIKLYNYIKFNYKVNKQLKKEIMKYSLPLVPNGISWWVVNISDRTIISLFLGVSMNGIYAIASKFPGIISTLFSIYNLSWSESASLNINSKERDTFFSDIFNMTLNVVFSISILLMAFMGIAFDFLIGKEYVESFNYIPLLVLATFLSCIMSFLSSVYIATKSTKKLANISIISAVINVIVDLLLIKQLKLYAACISTIVAYLVVLIYEYCDIRKIIKFNISKKNLVMFFFVFIAVMTIYYVNIVWLDVVCLVLCICYSLLINKEYIKIVFKSIKSKFN